MTSIELILDDEKFSEEEIASITIALKEAMMIKNGEIKPLSMDDLWDNLS